ncbi:DinB family protein [Paenibacillus sp.]|uniref:DinB family protein n=1 Tax=Paenibacillus sp. TaxID=58172 RepID=UPI0028120344|nr:DinB family protein [Paenibacillus sp.]
MTVKNELLKQFAEWNAFVDRIAALDWEQPLSEGKWNIHGVVCHIYFWDNYFLKEAIEPISKGDPATVVHLNYDEFNRSAVELGKSLPKEELIRLAKYVRTELVREIEAQDESKFSEACADGDGNPFTVETYLKDFIGHDRHHMKQIEAFANRT